MNTRRLDVDLLGPLVLVAAGIVLIVAAAVAAAGYDGVGAQLPYVNLGVGGVILCGAGNMTYLASLRRSVRRRRLSLLAPSPSRGGRRRGITNMKDLLLYVVIGVTAGSVYGLAGVGLVLTYRTSGVFNFAHGALATAGAYLFYDLWITVGVPWPIAAFLCIVVFGALLGMGMELLARRLAAVPTVVVVVATVGLLLAITSIATVRYGAATLTVRHFLPTSTFNLFGVFVSWEQVAIVAVGIVVSVGVSLLLARTRLGTAMRGVVDDPELMEITGFDATAVRRAAWMLGGSVAVLSGLLLVPSAGLNPLLLTYLVVQAFGAAAIGRFKSLPWTFVGGWIIGIAAAYGQRYASRHAVLLGLPNSLPFVALFVVLLAPRPGSLPGIGGLKRPRPERFSPLSRPARAALALGGLAAVVAVPYVVGAKLPVFIAAAGFTIVFLSLGLLVKTAGQVSLCHGAFVAVGAVAFSRLTIDVGVPWPFALIGAGLITMPIGAIVAVPAIRLKGIYLALATFAFAVLMENLAYRTFLLFGSEGSRDAVRPDLPGLDLASDRRYFYVAVAVAVVSAIVIVVIQGSRLGRLLRALADSPLALETFGTGINTTLVLLFCISAFLAGVAGAVLSAGTRGAGPADYGSFSSLLWIAIIAISGSRLVSSSVIAALLLAVMPAYLPDSMIEYQPIGFGVVAVLVALAAANRFDPVQRIRANLASSSRVGARSPVAARVADGGRPTPITAGRGVTR